MTAINGDDNTIAKALDKSHIHVTSHRSYNNEDALQSSIYLAYICIEKHTVVRDMTIGKGFADVVFLPFDSKIPAMIVELKRNKTMESDLDQIREKRYFSSLQYYQRNRLLVGII